MQIAVRYAGDAVQFAERLLARVSGSRWTDWRLIALTSHHFLTPSKRRSSSGGIPLMISLRFLRAFGLVNRLLTLPMWAGVDGLQVIGAPSELDMTLSLAMTFVDSGGSYICDASAGSDHNDGVELKIVVEEWERIEPKYILRGASDDVRV